MKGVQNVKTAIENVVIQADSKKLVTNKRDFILQK